MATEKTPPHKRIQRAESGRDEWKMKAMERREEIEQLKLNLSSKEASLEKLIQQNEHKNQKLTEAEKRIALLEKQVDSLKKKLS